MELLEWRRDNELSCILTAYIQGYTYFAEEDLLSVRLAIGVTVVHVLAVGSRVAETLQTFAALEGLLAAVQPFVFRQVMLVLEGLGALITFVRTLS